MKVTMMLADAAQAVNGKLYIMGGGWSVMGPEPTPYAIALKVEVPWDETNKRHTLVLRLLDDDGRPVRVAARNEDPSALEVPAYFGVGRPSAGLAGGPIEWPFVIKLAPMPMST